MANLLPSSTSGANPLSAPARTRLEEPPPSTRESHPNNLEQELHRARKQGVFGLMRLKYEAWLEERMKVPVMLKLKARQEVLDEQKKTTEAEMRLQSTMQSSYRDRERQRIEWNQVHAARIQSDLAACGITSTALVVPGNGSAPAFNPSGPPLEMHISDEQIEALALRAVMTLGQTPDGETAEDHWLSYRDQLYQQLPQYAAREVETRIGELRAAAGKGR